jgi:hydroxymethylglutaryl-CoA reductase
MDRSRIPGFYKESVEKRLAILHERGILSDAQLASLKANHQTLDIDAADRMVENVIGVFGLPLGLGLNFIINEKAYIVPLVVEEPSIIAALSSAAKIVSSGGGFQAEMDDSLLMGQIQVVDVGHPARARQTLLQNRQQILNLANSLHPNMVARGGGAKDLEITIHPSSSMRGDMMVVHLLVDTCDAMGANLVNTMCEGVAHLIEELTKGKVFLRILSNLTDRSMVKAKATIPLDALVDNGYSGEEVRNGIILANEFAAIDPYRATTHNKGIMNGIDAVALATGNDWRAIEAAAHAYAGRGHSYTCLTNWHQDKDGNLVGSLHLPLKVGIVGGNLRTNPAVSLGLDILNVKSAKELAQVMAAVGLAQNFSALKALSTEGIQRGHMGLHARSVAMSAGARPEHFDTVVNQLIDSGEVKMWKAKEIIASIEDGQPKNNGKQTTGTNTTREKHCGYGKVIVLGEHAVVYGSHAIAAPISLSIETQVHARKKGVHLSIPRWGFEQELHIENQHDNSLTSSMAMMLDKLELVGQGMDIEVWPDVPRAMGLGASAALAVSIARALSAHFKLDLNDAQVNELAFASDQIVHGQSSGIDNTLATYRNFILFQKGEPPLMQDIKVPKAIPIVIGLTSTEGLTAKMVAKVENQHKKNPHRYDNIFKDIDNLTLQAVTAVENYDLEQLGDLMNVCQGMLNALGVSSWELEELIQIARDHGALGAKLTGGGGGGSMVALCPDDADAVVAAMVKAGYQAIQTEIGGSN